MKAGHPFNLLMSLVLLSVILMSGDTGRAWANERPVAEAGLSRYAGAEPVRLDGAGSYDPDGSGPLSYAWRQLSGPAVVITDANTATPLIGMPDQTDSRGRPIPGQFPQTDAIQEWEFELVVNDGELTSLPDIVKIIVVPGYGANTLTLQNAPFNVNRPTFVYFGGGDCTIGGAGQGWSGPDWLSQANIISVSATYSPDSNASARTYYKYADMLIVYLSSVAPDYKQPIQTSGWSTGGQPAIDVGLRLNLTYKDARYAVNRVTFFDATPYCRTYSDSIQRYLASAVDGEQCWVDNYVGQSNTLSFPSVLNINSTLAHAGVPQSYRDSPGVSDLSRFNHGIVAGAYWSVIGPGKNLQLAFTPGQTLYRFEWLGDPDVGYMDLYDAPACPGKLPEPVTLGAWVSRSRVSGETDGAVLSCYRSENAVGYQLLFGTDPYRVMDYAVVSDTPTPPTEVRREFPSGPTWWTIRARDPYGSTIYADPVLLDLANLPALSVENARTAKRYGLIGHALLEAESGDVIVLDAGTYDESIEFGDKTIVVRSLDPNNPESVAGTVLRGRSGNPAVTFSGPGSGACMLVGLTIQGDPLALSCRDAAPTIRQCVLGSEGGIAAEFWWGREPTLVDCTLVGEVKEGGDPGLIGYWRLDETAGAVAADEARTAHATLVGDPQWQPAGGKISGAIQLDGVDDHLTTPFVLNPANGRFSVFAWIKGGAPGQVILSQDIGDNWLMAGAPDGALITELKSIGRQGKPLSSKVVIADGQWHNVGLTWDGSNRVLYVDGAEVTRDTQPNLPGSETGLCIGAGGKPGAGAFWSGLIDDIRIYNRAVKP